MQAALSILSRDFNGEIATALSALQPTVEEVAVQGRERAYSTRYARWKRSNRDAELFQQIGIAVPRSGHLELKAMDPSTGSLVASRWPPAWANLQQALLARVRGGQPPQPTGDPFLFEIPRFGAAPGSPRGTEQDWLILELNPQYVRGSMIPELLERHLPSAGVIAFEAEVFSRADPSMIIYRSHKDSKESAGSTPEASVALFEPLPGPGGPHREGPRGPAMAPPDGGRGRWQMVVRSRGGSLDAIVSGPDGETWRSRGASSDCFSRAWFYCLDPRNALNNSPICR